jgi:hypothetical protein
VNATWATAVAWLLTAVVVAGAVWLVWLVVKKLLVTAAHHLARVGDRARAWAAVPFGAAAASGRAGRAAWTDRASRPDPAPSVETTARQERWGQTRPGRAAVRVERGAVRTGQGVGRWSGAGAAAIGSGIRAVPEGWTDGVEHVRELRRRRRAQGRTTTDPDATGPGATGPDQARARRWWSNPVGDDAPAPSTGWSDPDDPDDSDDPDDRDDPDDPDDSARPGRWGSDPDDLDDLDRPGRWGSAPDDLDDSDDPDDPDAPEGPDPTEDTEGPGGTRVATEGPAVGLPVEVGPPRTPYEAGLSPEELEDYRVLKAIRASGYTGALDQDNYPVPDDPQPVGGDGTRERTGQAGAPDTKEIPMAEVTEFTNTTDLRAEVEELETTAEELAEQVGEFHRRRELIEEKVGAAPFGTRAIAEAAAAVSDAKTLEEAREALVELRRAVEESDAVADVSESLDAKGDVEAFATA